MICYCRKKLLVHILCQYPHLISDFTHWVLIFLYLQLILHLHLVLHIVNYYSSQYERQIEDKHFGYQNMISQKIKFRGIKMLHHETKNINHPWFKTLEGVTAILTRT